MEGDKLTLWWFIGSQPSRAVKTLLNIGNVPHDTIEVNLMLGEHQTPEYLANVNKRGLIPVIKDGDFKLSESNAILKYLYDTRHTIPRTLFPEDGKTRLATDELLEWYQCHFRPAMTGPLKVVLGAKRAGVKPDEDNVNYVTALIKPQLDTLEEVISRSAGPYLTGPHLTIADL